MCVKAFFHTFPHPKHPSKTYRCFKKNVQCFSENVQCFFKNVQCFFKNNGCFSQNKRLFSCEHFCLFRQGKRCHWPPHERFRYWLRCIPFLQLYQMLFFMDGNNGRRSDIFVSGRPKMSVRKVLKRYFATQSTVNRIPDI